MMILTNNFQQLILSIPINCGPCCTMDDGLLTTTLVDSGILQDGVTVTVNTAGCGLPSGAMSSVFKFCTIM